jgi:hypothetical protein
MKLAGFATFMLENKYFIEDLNGRGNLESAGTNKRF